MTSQVEIYLNKKWNFGEKIGGNKMFPCVLFRGEKLTLPYTIVRQSPSMCKSCNSFLHNRTSYQSRKGESYCEKCYSKLSDKDVEELFGGHQWFSYEGQIPIKDMDDRHLVNTLKVLKARAEKISRINSEKDTKDKYLDKRFKVFLKELQKRFPSQSRIIKKRKKKFNKKQSLIMTFIGLMSLIRGSAREDLNE